MEFNWKIYRYLNTDLIEHNIKTKEQLVKHYESHGKKEKRKKSILDIYPDYNSVNYRYNNRDLQNLSEEDLEAHYIMYGNNEKRVYNRKIQYFYIISNIEAGGSVKYIKDLIEGFPETKFIIINNRKQFLETAFRENDVILLQQLLHTRINIQDVIEMKKRINLFLILCIHDFYWLNKSFKNDNIVNPHSRYLEISNVLPEVKELIEICNEVIHPSKFTYDNYSKFVNNRNFKIVSHNDAKVKLGIKNIPKIENNMIKIGFLHDFIEVKGGEYIVKLFEKYKLYRDYNIEFLVVKKNIRPYKEEEFFEYIKKLGIHCLTYLSKWGETWSYSLTKGLNSGLPIIYNNFGAFKERIPESEHYFKVHDNESEIENDERLYEVFEKLLDYIIDNNGHIEEMNEDMKIEYNRYYKRLFNLHIE